MGRNALFGKNDIMAAAAREAAHGRSLTIQTLAETSGASVGSIYHRFDSRSALLAETWLHAVESFQEAFLPPLHKAATPEQGCAAALVVPRWSRSNLPLAALLALRSQTDFVGPETPAPLRRRAASANGVLAREIEAFSKRTRLSLLTCRVALIGMPYGSVRLFLPGRVPPDDIDDLIARAYHGLVKS